MAVHESQTLTPSEVEPYRFTVEEFLGLDLPPEHRYELIDGEILVMSPIGPRHADLVERLADDIRSKLGKKARVREEKPIRMGKRGLPQPDIAVVEPGNYAKDHPTPAAVLWIVEVSDTTLRYDLSKKIPAYARAGIPEVWLLDLKNRKLLIFREPKGSLYRVSLTLEPGEPTAPLAFPRVEIDFSW